jgi:luciferase family oxidoreductase group 1
MKLSVLDQSVAVAGRPQSDAIRDTLALAEHCEALGYHRFWLSEHHSHPTIVGSAPEVLMAAVAARTTRMRIGSAGVMLPHYASLKVAEQFRVLDALAPGRIDLGVGRAPGSEYRTSQLLNPNANASEDFPRQVLELQAWVTGSGLPPGHPGHGVEACPTGSTAPALWMLGSSSYGAQLAAHYGLPYAFAYFITDGHGVAEALELYRHNFKPTAAHPRPHATVCVWALAADTLQDAWHHFRSRERWRMDRNSGRIGPLLPPDEALRDYSAAELPALERLRANARVLATR